MDCVEVTFEWKKQIPTSEKKVFFVGVCEDMLILDWNDRKRNFTCSKYVIPGTYGSLSIIIGESGGIYRLLPIVVDSLPRQTVSLIMVTSSTHNPENQTLNIKKHLDYTNQLVSPKCIGGHSLPKVQKNSNYTNVFEKKSEKTDSIDDISVKIGVKDTEILNVLPRSYLFSPGFNSRLKFMEEQIIDLESQVIKLNRMFSNSIAHIAECQTEIAKLQLEMETFMNLKLRQLDIIQVPSEKNDHTQVQEELTYTKYKLRLSEERKEILIHLAKYI